MKPPDVSVTDEELSENAGNGVLYDEYPPDPLIRDVELTLFAETPFTVMPETPVNDEFCVRTRAENLP